MNTMKIMRRAENFMIIKNIWMMVGFTIWSLRNIFTLVTLIELGCFTSSDQDKGYRFWMLNFIVFTVVGYILAILTIFVIPGIALYHCYQESDRSNDTNMYLVTKNDTGRSYREQTLTNKSIGVFDQHQVASRRKNMKINQQQITLDDIRSKLVDVFVNHTTPKTNIKFNYEDILIEAFDGKEEHTEQVSLIKDLLLKNKVKCDICNQFVKFNQIVRIVMHHDCYIHKANKESRYSHVIHSECYFKQVVAKQEMSKMTHKIPPLDKKCYCESTFFIKKEEVAKNLFTNLINQYYDT